MNCKCNETKNNCCTTGNTTGNDEPRWLCLYNNMLSAAGIIASIISLYCMVVPSGTLIQFATSVSGTTLVCASGVLFVLRHYEW